jgi:hypothetical protein
LVCGREVLFVVVVCVIIAIATLTAASVKTPHQESDDNSPDDYAREETRDKALS